MFDPPLSISFLGGAKDGRRGSKHSGSSLVSIGAAGGVAAGGNTVTTNSRLFEGMKFLVSSGIPSSSATSSSSSSSSSKGTTDGKESLITLLKEHGAQVLEEIHFQRRLTEDNKARERAAKESSVAYSPAASMDAFLENIGLASTGYILLTQPTKFRKRNNIIMGATNGTLLHYSWAAQCVAAGTLLDVQGFMLPSCAHPLTPWYIFPIEKPPPRSGVLGGVRILNLAGHQQCDMLVACGCTIVINTPELLRKLQVDQPRVDRDEIVIDMVVVDPKRYADAKIAGDHHLSTAATGMGQGQEHPWIV